MKMNYIIILMLLLCCSYCEKESTNEIIIFSRYLRNAEILTRMNQKVVKQNDIKYISFDLEYRGEISSNIIELPEKGKRHKYLVLDNEIVTSKIDSIYIAINKVKHKIIKYHLDRTNSIDEESIYYYTEKYGILRWENYHWRSHFILIDDNQNNVLEIYQLNEVIRNLLKPYNPWNEDTLPKALYNKSK